MSLTATTRDVATGGSIAREDVGRYRELGYHFPVRVMSQAGADELRRRLESFEARHGGSISGGYRHKSHLLFTWLSDLVRHPALLDAVESVIGPDILCWNSNFFAKEPDGRTFVSWHQDATYFGLDPIVGMTAWIAFTASRPENGCMRVIPGSHKTPVAHIDRPNPDNILSRGQRVGVDVEESAAVDLVLAPGEMSLHDLLIVHGSRPNASGHRRIGFAVRYIPTWVRQRGARDSATLVRGSDSYGHFDPEPAPASDLDSAAREAHREILARHTELLMRSAEQAELK